MKIKKRKVTAIVAVLMVLFVASFFLREYIANALVGYNMDSIETPKVGDRVLIFAPHSDDEAIGAGELIRQSILNGAEVRVVVVTNGDGFRRAVSIESIRVNPRPDDFINYGRSRQQESIDAMTFLGMDRADVIFYGYPDRGLSKLWSSNWMNDKPYKSAYTRQDKSPYKDTFSEGALYTGESLYMDILTLIDIYKPTHILYPHSNDRHPDHWALNCFIKYVLTKHGYEAEHEWVYLVHRGGWPTPLKQNRSLYLVPPMSLLFKGTRWLTLEMTDESIEIKSQAFKKYKSQYKRIKSLMSAFERKNELFGIYENIELRKYLTSEDSMEACSENLIIEDPAKDALNLELSSSSDIISVHAEVSEEEKLHIFIKLRSRVNKNVAYRLSMVFFNGEEVKRLNILAKDKSLSMQQGSDSSFTDVKDIELKIMYNTLHFVIPENKIGEYSSVFINTETIYRSFSMDRTAWRMLIAE